MAGKRTITVEIIGDASGLGKAAGDVEKMAGQIGGGLDDAGVKGKAAIDKLGLAVGPELGARMDAAGLSVDSLVGKLKEAGFSFDDIAANADDLAAHIREIDTANGSIDGVAEHARGLGRELDTTNEYGRQTRSVMANMVGNSAQDFGQLAGVTGSLGVGIGQMAEYATEGEIKLKGLVVAGAGIAGVGLAMQLLGDRAKEVAAFDAFNVDRVKSYTDAVREGKTELQGVLETLQGTEKIIGGFGALKFDITPQMAEMGVSVEEFSQLVAGSDEQLQAWEQAMKDAGFGGKDLAAIIGGVRLEQDHYTQATKSAEVASRVFGDSEAVKAQKLEQAKDQVTAQSAALGEMYQRQYDATIGADELAKKLDAARDASHDAADKQFELNSKIYDVQKKIDDQNAAWDDLFGKYDEEKSFLNIEQSFDDLKAKIAETETAMADQTISQEEGQRNQRLAIIGTKEEVARYIEKLGGIPADKATEIIAQIDRGQYDAVQKDLDWLTRKRDMGVTVTFTTPGPIKVPTSVGPKLALAGGGDVMAGQTYLVGEDGPELFRSATAGTIIPNHQLASLASYAPGPGVTQAAAAGGTTINVYQTINGTVMRQEDVQRDLWDGMQDMLRRGALVGSLG